MRIGRAYVDLAITETAPFLSERRPALVVDAAAYTAVDQAETEPDAARALNADLPGRPAGIRITTSCLKRRRLVRAGAS